MVDAPPQPGQMPDPGAEDVSPQERAQVGQWAERIKRGRKIDKDAIKKFKTWRERVAGKYGDDGEAGLVRTNLILATMEALVPYIYAQDPEIVAPPAESVTSERYRVAKPFGKTLEIVLNHQFRGAALKPVMKRSVRRAMTTGLAWLKITYQRDIRSDPLIQQRIQDAQDNLLRLKSQAQDIADDQGGGPDLDAKRAELEQQIAALEQQVEVTVAEGIAVDPVLTEDILVDPGLMELVDYTQAGWIAERVWFEPDEARALFQLTDEQMQPASTYRRKSSDDDQKDQAASPPDTQDQKWVACWEIWDRRSNTVLTMIEGLQRWARPPYQPRRLGERWFPFFALAFHWVDGMRWPVADVDLWADLQDEFNAVRTGYRKHRRRAIPKTLVNADISPEDVARINRAEREEMIPVTAPGNQPLQNYFAEALYAKVDPALYDTTPIRMDLEQVSGVQDAQRGAAVASKTATASEIEQSGFASRTTERRAAIEMVIEDMARYAAEIVLQELTPQQVLRIAGPGAVWPQLSRGEVYDLVSVEVRAGSSGKPNQAREQQMWTQMVPQVLQLLQAYQQALMAGQVPVAEALRAILQKTFQVMDERMDIDEILPPPEATAQPPMGGLAEAFGAAPGAPGIQQPGVNAPQPRLAPPQLPPSTGTVVPFTAQRG